MLAQGLPLLCTQQISVVLLLLLLTAVPMPGIELALKEHLSTE